MRVLVVEDERHLAGGIKRGLEAEGFAVDIALDGPDGLERANEGDYDAIVLEIMLTPRQFSLLEYLMRKAGEVVSKAEILEHVWDYAFEGDPNIVEVYIRHLRKRIDEPFGRNAIQTVRLVGYRLGADGG